jgi:hypothetical protein
MSEIEGIGFTVTGHEEDYFQMVDPEVDKGECPDGIYIGMVGLLRKAGVEALSWSDEFAFQTFMDAPENINDINDWVNKKREQVAAWRKDNGREWPRLHRVKITVEVEEVEESVSEAYWARHHAWRERLGD